MAGATQTSACDAHGRSQWSSLTVRLTRQTAAMREALGSHLAQGTAPPQALLDAVDRGLVALEKSIVADWGAA